MKQASPFRWYTAAFQQKIVYTKAFIAKIVYDTNYLTENIKVFIEKVRFLFAICELSSN